MSEYMTEKSDVLQRGGRVKVPLAGYGEKPENEGLPGELIQ